MAEFSNTWWGERFLEALEQFTDPARLGRRRSYARGDRVRELRLEKGKISAKVRGKKNPYKTKCNGHLPEKPPLK